MCFVIFQVRDLSVAYLLVGLTYMYVGVLIFAAFPSPPLTKDCIEPVRFVLLSFFYSHAYIFACYILIWTTVASPLCWYDNIIVFFCYLLMECVLTKSKLKLKKKSNFGIDVFCAQSFATLKPVFSPVLCAMLSGHCILKLPEICLKFLGMIQSADLVKPP